MSSGKDGEMPVPDDVSTLLNNPIPNEGTIGKRKKNDGEPNSNGKSNSNKKGKSSTKVKSFFNFNTLFENVDTYFETVTRILGNFKTQYNAFKNSYNNIINGTRIALTTAKEDLTTAANNAEKVAIPIIKRFHEDINNIRERGLVMLSDAYDGYLTATGLVEDLKEGLGFQTIDTIILEHEKMACIALLELVYDDGKGTFIDLNTTNIGGLITRAMKPDGEENYTEKQKQVRTHIEMAVKVYFIFKHGKSAVEYMSIIASKGINYGDLNVAARSNRGLNEQYLIDSHNKIVNNILDSPLERNAFLTNVVNNILLDPVSPSIDHSKYYGMSVTADAFIRNKFSDIRISIDSLKTQYNFYISDRANTGKSIHTKYIPRLIRIKNELNAITEELKGQKLEFTGTSPKYINEKIATQSGELQEEIDELGTKMNTPLQDIANSKACGKESSGGKKTRRRKATSSRRVSLRKRKSKRDKRSNQSKGTLKKKHSKKHKA